MATNTLRHIIYNIRTLIKDVRSDDIKFTDRNIAYWIKYLRARIIRQQVNNNQTIGDAIIQNIPVNFTSKDSGSELGFETGEFIIKSSTKLPKFISTHKKDLLLDIHSEIDDCFVITIQPRAKAIRNYNNKYGKRYPVAYLENGYIYLKGCNFYVENLVVSGVFQDPEEVERFSNPDITEDEFMDMEYPIDDDMINQINDLVKANELNLYFQIPEDKVNDAQTNSL